MSGWILAWIIGGVVVVAVVALLVIAIVLASRIAARAESIAAGLRDAADATQPIAALAQSTATANRILLNATRAGDQLEGQGQR